MEITCLNCENVYAGNFCPNCGQKKNTHRLTFKSILHDIPHSVFHVDKGLLHTFIELLIRPGRLLRNYIDGKRVNYFAPFAYLFFMSAVSSFIVHQTFEHLHIHYNYDYMLFPRVSEFFAHYPALMLCTLIPFVSFWSWVFHRETGLNYWENFVLNTYLVAQFNVFYIIQYSSGLLTGVHTGSTVPLIVAFVVYLAYAYVQFFRRKISVARVVKNTIMMLLIAFTLLNGLMFTGFMTPYWNREIPDKHSK